LQSRNSLNSHVKTRLSIKAKTTTSIDKLAFGHIRDYNIRL